MGAFAADDGKSDAAKSTKLVDDIALDSTIEGDFDRKTRVYGYIVEAKKGAKLTVRLTATAGQDAEGPQPGAALDTFLGVYGPFESIKKPGPAIVESEDGAESLAAPPVKFESQTDARYLVAFSSWEDTGKGHYRLSVSCEGTDLQCRRPDWKKPCVARTIYLQGGRVETSQTWEQCEVVLLEPTTIAKEATLTIRPGVTVKGNFLGGDSFGNVTLIAEGTLQASGLVVEDSVIRENQTGVLISGAGATNQCYSVSSPTVWRDPRFVHTDIVANAGLGILIQGSDVLVQVESCNIVKNAGGGIQVLGSALNPESYLRRNNIHGNTGLQVYSLHRSGTLDISGNYWSHISDPELSASWQMACDGTVTFRGFSPTAIADAGPRPERLCDSVKQETWAQKQSQ